MSFPKARLVFYDIFSSLALWGSLSLVVGLLAGSASAVFLLALDRVTHVRLEHPWLLYMLPFAGALGAILYQRWGKSVEAGNSLLIDEIHDPKKIIPLRMAPLVLFGTLLTHLFGGSAGREGTAVQMGASLSDQITHLLNLDSEKRKTLLMMGIAAGFGSVFGTPLAGALFALEVLAIGRLRTQTLLPCLLAAIIADRTCVAWGAHHTLYSVTNTPSLEATNLISAMIAGVIFGLCALAFSRASHWTSHTLKRILPSATLRAFVGGLVLVALTSLLQTDRYLGLGVPVIVESFTTQLPGADFLFKMLFTIITLSVGFKGGEVTPLFFIGATLGSALSWILPLPTSLLAGMGFVAVFAGAANTPLACIVMSLELFGSQPGVFMALACVVSYYFSGHQGIYQTQKIEDRKYAQKN